MEFKFLPTPKTFLSLIVVIIISSVAISYEAQLTSKKIAQETYNDPRRTFLLVVAYLILIYNAYYLSVKTQYVLDRLVKFSQIFASWFYNLLAAFLGAILISYLGTPECDWVGDTYSPSSEGIYDDWRKGTIIGLSSTALALSILVFISIIYYAKKGKRGAQFVARLTPAKFSAQSL